VVEVAFESIHVSEPEPAERSQPGIHRRFHETSRLNIVRRFGSAMISNIDSTLLVYSAEYIHVKVYIGRGARATVLVGVRGCTV